MPRRVAPPTDKRIWPLHERDRVGGVISHVDHDARCGQIRHSGEANGWQGEDVPFFAEDVFGPFSNFHQGRTVSFRLNNGVAVEVCNIHDRESEQALLDWQIANSF